ncbi:ABC transporter ATP-binding protein [Liquorilactobacillus vini]|uniref:Multidrug ABC transporter ATPase permease n=1 Tax=Liquorilactobacillus vini DSM 20605 TaxID=1133569 RepID=A0A0R2CP57_9LACO|nr:ABC transporter transmembrane domain-containing protein [Liquorilactobacillus vini]KRM89587.1 multidrug ABC transporter ATPase permease [Liquorilactobacillus vini DSM 20605]
MTIFKKLSWFFKEQKQSYFKGIFFLLMVALANIIPPKVVGIIIDLIQHHQLKPTTLSGWLLLLIIVAVFQYLCRFSWRKYIWGSAALLEKKLRGRLMDHYLKMDENFYQQHRIGDLMAHATNDVNAVQEVAGYGILTLADSLITGGTTLAAMIFLVDWRLTLIAILPLPLLTLLSSKLGGKIHQAYDDSQAAFSRINNKTQESIQGIQVIRTLGQEKEDLADFKKQVNEVIQTNQKAYRLDALFDPLTSLIIGLAYVMTIIIGGMMVLKQTISIGQLVSFIAYIGNLIWPMFAIGGLFNVIELGSASYDRIERLLRIKSQITELQGAITTPPQGELKFAISEFSYSRAKQPALIDLAFSLKNGQTLGIVGPTGAGKSTLLQLLVRRFDNYHGKITYGGIDIRDYSLDSYLPAIGYVPQISLLFSMSIADNIRFAKPTASQAEIERASSLAGLQTDILSFPAGFKTQVGEQGITLSGGQKQRLSIARAILLNPELLILDDALSAVDAKTEQQILQNLKSIRQNKTTIIAASRLSSVAAADKIIVLDHGRIVQQGQHQALISQAGWYQRTFQIQQKKVLSGD